MDKITIPASANWTPGIIRSTIKALKRLEEAGQKGGRGTPRGFVRARYVKAAGVKPERLELSPVRQKVLRTICSSGSEGCLYRQIRRKTGITHGSAQQTLNWLRLQGFVKAREDWKPEP